jgi:hypothetical protein
MPDRVDRRPDRLSPSFSTLDHPACIPSSMKLHVLFLTASLPGALLAQQPSIETIDKNFSDAADTDGWIYNDLDKGFAEAKAAGKPLMVVYRCIP